MRVYIGNTKYDFAKIDIAMGLNNPRKVLLDMTMHNQRAI